MGFPDPVSGIWETANPDSAFSALAASTRQESKTFDSVARPDQSKSQSFLAQ
jgi:hypothetical protein